MKVNSIGVFNVSLASVLLVLLVFASVTPSSGIGEYDPWIDLNDDGSIDIFDAIMLAGAFGSSGSSITKASLEYDSGWINITDAQRQSITVAHGLNVTDWNNSEIIVEITGKKTLNGNLLRYLGVTGYFAGFDKKHSARTGLDADGAHGVVQTNDGGYALAGFTQIPLGIGVNTWLVKTDAAGNMQWNRTFVGMDNEAWSLVQTNDGGYALAGEIENPFWDDFLLIKYNLSGNYQWNKTYGGSASDVARSIVQTSDGGYVLAGWTESFGAGASDMWLVKTNSSGNMEWNRTYGGVSGENARSVIQTSDGGYAIAGSTLSFGAGAWDFWLVKTNSSGSVQWNATYGGVETDEAVRAIQTSDGGYAIAGTTASYGAGLDDFWLVKTNSTGGLEWTRTYGEVDSEVAYELVQTSGGGYAIVGITGDPSHRMWLVETDVAGNMVWNWNYSGGAFACTVYSIIQVNDWQFVMAGWVIPEPQVMDMWLVKNEFGRYGLIWTDSDADTITLFKGADDTDWNYVRVQIWKVK